MSRTLVRLSIPERLRDEMMLKTGSANSFDVPHTRAGVQFLSTWEEMGTPRRDALMKFAYARNVDIVAAHRALSDAETSAINGE